MGESQSAAKLRRGLALLLFAYSLELIILTVRGGHVPPIPYWVVPMLAAALWSNRGGRFARDWLAVFAGMYTYRLTGVFARSTDFAVHYKPQIDIDRLIGFGNVPTIWLQHHLYGGSTGPLEVASLFLYLSHFIVPLAFAFFLWWTRRQGVFKAYMFGLLVVSLLGGITFVLAPTAPPWLAAEHGFLPPVHHVIKQALFDINLHKQAALDGSPKSYNIVAAAPSLHAAWPVVGLLAARYFRLPRAIRVVFAVQFVAIVFVIVYTGEHYLFDAVLGAVYAVVGFRCLMLAAGWKRESGARQSERTEAVSPEPVIAPAPALAQAHEA